ncbi:MULTISPECIES: hypothetical protein [unclassified Rhodococcus (in: high G+C Gram-positive bacteria)]|uniref:hypothetical protein n=1 Tax=unclassified Rhodococcus (in: high G+C Gram-positive bacteria) TaxID=192944 RepID=UPI000B9AAFCE|nr:MULTISPECIES: hypothetical protein [unclassified Rhodococcus (in: high G+C Gram-positive bacteria)]OZE36258.1 hypothetical protein CH259_13275 [Rhodococcus sp. 05-2254-4]OZE41354.1 hypothetical protein CH261_25340 [Rhodococcus sp. 05-2254-3]OZE44700.1 hypothetical protein CH283_27595 [Rhodococcus sp. 05-2254-2]
MLKKVLAGVALAIGGAVLLAPTASAAPEDNPFGPTDSTANFVSAFDPAAYGAASATSLIASPFGTSRQIDCWSFHARGSCSQNGRVLTEIRIPAGSSEWDYRTLYVYNPF